MVIELALVLRRLALGAVHLGDLRDGPKYRIDNLFITGIDFCADRQVIRTLEMRFDALDKGREVPDEEGNALALASGGLGVVDDLDLLVLLVSYEDLKIIPALERSVEWLNTAREMLCPSLQRDLR